MDAAGSQRAALVGLSEGVPMSVVFAASHPARVSALVLYGGMARVLWAPDYQFGIPERTYRRELEQEADWFMTPGNMEALLRSGLPSADDGEVRAWTRIIRYGACQVAGLAPYRIMRAHARTSPSSADGNPPRSNGSMFPGVINQSASCSSSRRYVRSGIPN